MKITVVIPLFNKEATILRAVNSVLLQTCLPEEIIVVNDGSTDGSEQIVAGLNHPLIRLINQPNTGVSAARNKGIIEAKGDWVAFLDADDEWLPQFVETIRRLIENYPECHVAATGYFMKYPTGKREKNQLRKQRFSGDHGIMVNYFTIAACSHPPINSSAVAVQKEVIQSISGFPPGVTSGEDLLTWARLAVVSHIAYSTRPLSIFTQNPAHHYIDKPNRIPQIPDIVGQDLKMLSRSKKKIPGMRRYLGHWHKMRSSIYLRLGMRRNSLCESALSLFYYPLNVRVISYLILLAMPSRCVNLIFRKLSQ